MIIFLIFILTLQESVEDTLLADKRRLAREVRFYDRFYVCICFMPQVFVNKSLSKVDVPRSPFLERAAYIVDIHNPRKVQLKVH